ncbi:Hypp2158 [Branchiostoma lanceolatum]|uniref:Hypp2158 protein n=1 Tax=Branchiostoma lanceolatum TaxID=7740 RepID=A0A8J9ZP62_BRALA|nr:Hypp2158 [Branchiostoma lanceolatum]
MMIVIYSTSTCLALFFLYRVAASCRRCYNKRLIQRHYLHSNAAGAIGVIPLQQIQPPPADGPATGNPLPPHQTYAEIPDDTPIDPYAETTCLENPAYAADVTGPTAATSISKPRPRSSRPPNPLASSQPQGSSTTRTGNTPVPLPRPVDSTYYPPSMKTTPAKEIPDPLRRTNRKVDSNVSPQPQGLEMPQAEKVPDPLPRTHTYVNSNVSSQPHGVEMPKQMPSSGASSHSRSSNQEEEVEGLNIYLDLNGQPRYSGSKMPQAEDRPNQEEFPDPLLRTHTYVNSNVSSQRRGSQRPNQEEIPDPLPRTHAYVNSNVSSQRRGSQRPNQEEIPDPLPRTHTYVNSNVSSQRRGSKRPNQEEIPDPLPRTHTYVNSNVSSQRRGSQRPNQEEIPDPLPRTHTYVNSNVSSQRRGSQRPNQEEIPEPLPRTHTYINSNISRSQGAEMSTQMSPSRASPHAQGSKQEGRRGSQHLP